MEELGTLIKYMENKEKHCNKCSNKTEEGLAISGCLYCGCHQSPHQEPVSTQKECYCQGKKEFKHHSKHLCHNFLHPIGDQSILDYENDKKMGVVMRNEEPQEPMEWENWSKEFDEIFPIEIIGMKGEKIKQFISEVIKQAEERVLNELREVVKDDEDGSDTLEEIIISRKILN